MHEEQGLPEMSARDYPYLKYPELDLRGWL